MSYDRIIAQLNEIDRRITVARRLVRAQSFLIGVLIVAVIAAWLR